MKMYIVRITTDGDEWFPPYPFTTLEKAKKAIKNYATDTNGKVEWNEDLNAILGIISYYDENGEIMYWANLYFDIYNVTVDEDIS